MAAQIVTFTATSAGTITGTDWFVVELCPGVEAPTGNASAGMQSLHVAVTCATAAGAGTLQLAWASKQDGSTDGADQGVQMYKTLSVAATARRQSFDNTAGDYVCDVTYGTNTTGWVDLGPISVEGNMKLYIGMQAIGTLGTTNVWLRPTRYV